MFVIPTDLEDGRPLGPARGVLRRPVRGQRVQVPVDEAGRARGVVGEHQAGVRVRQQLGAAS